MKLSVVIPAYNEAESLTETVSVLHSTLIAGEIDHEILVVNDNSKDDTLIVLAELTKTVENLTYVTNLGPNGFGNAVRKGLDHFKGDCVAIMMADLSDSPDDLVRFYRAMRDGNYDCVFGSRFITGGSATDYPAMKKLLNRLANLVIRIAFGIRYNDTTNAFKLYSRATIEGIGPLLSPHFNLTVEMPLKAIIRGYSYKILPNSWRNRKYGVSKSKIRELGSRYFFIFLYCLIEKYFSKGDFRKKW